MADRDEEQATQEVADWLRRQEWDGPVLIGEGGEATKERVTQLWWVSRAEETLDVVAEAGAKFFGHELDADEREYLKALIRNITPAVVEDDEVEAITVAVVGFINKQVM